MSLDLASLPSCTRCALSTTRQRVVVGAGPLRPAVMIIGEAPGRNEDEGGEPFIGRSGQLLFRLLEEETGLERSQCFVTNVVKCRPPANRTPTRGEIEACRPWIDEQLLQVAPKVVLAVGATAARSLFGTVSPMSELHGQVRALGAAQALCTYHPAAALRAANSVVPMMRSDLQILKGLL